MTPSDRRRTHHTFERVFKTAALGHYASPPDRNTVPEPGLVGVALSPRAVAGRRRTPRVVSAASALLARSGSYSYPQNSPARPPADIGFHHPGASRTAVLQAAAVWSVDGIGSSRARPRVAATKRRAGTCDLGQATFVAFLIGVVVLIALCVLALARVARAHRART